VPRVTAVVVAGLNSVIVIDSPRREDHGKAIHCASTVQHCTFSQFKEKPRELSRKFGLVLMRPAVSMGRCNTC
jgi:hypothetical protein